MAVMLIQKGADPGRVTRIGNLKCSVLSLAIWSGQCDLVSRLLASMGDQTAIYFVIQVGPLIVVEMYIQSVPDAAGKRKRCNEILNWMAEMGSPRLTTAIFACAITHGGDPEALDDGRCAVLLKAVFFGNSKAVRLLLSRGPQP